VSVAEMTLEQCAFMLAADALGAEVSELDDFMREHVEFWDDMSQSEKLLTVCRLAIASRLVPSE